MSYCVNLIAHRKRSVVLSLLQPNPVARPSFYQRKAHWADLLLRIQRSIRPFHGGNPEGRSSFLFSAIKRYMYLGHQVALQNVGAENETCFGLGPLDWLGGSACGAIVLDIKFHTIQQFFQIWARRGAV